MAKPNFREVVKLGPSRSPRHGARVINLFLHTQEGGGTAESLANYLNNPNNNASYHWTVDDNTLCHVVDVDYASWSVLNANPQSLNLCFAGSRASQSRQQWTDNFRNAIRIAAWVAADEVRRKFPYVDVKTVQGRPYRKGRVSCVSDHYYVTSVLRIGNHTDVGPNFPWDLFESDLHSYLSPAAPPAPPVNRINELAAKTAWLGKRIATGRENEIGEVVTSDGKGRFAKFENGYVYWHPRTGAHAVPNELFEQWAALKWEQGPLGYPTVEFTELDGGLVQAFEKGVLYLQDGADQGYYVTGVIGTRWARSGYENGPLGYPVSNEYEYGDGGRRQDFEHGYATWHPSGALLVKNVELVVNA